MGQEAHGECAWHQRSENRVLAWELFGLLDARVPSRTVRKGNVEPTQRPRARASSSVPWAHPSHQAQQRPRLGQRGDGIERTMPRAHRGCPRRTLAPPLSSPGPAEHRPEGRGTCAAPGIGVHSQPACRPLAMTESLLDRDEGLVLQLEPADPVTASPRALGRGTPR